MMDLGCYDRGEMMKRVIVAGMMVALCACESVRTVYDEFGNVVKESESSGGEKDLTAHMEEKWDKTFSEKKNDQGIPQAVSNRVSSFQKDLDGASSTDKQFFTKRYEGADTNDVYSMQFSGAGKKYGVKEAYTGGLGERIEKELHPAFASSSRGIYSTADSYARGSARYGREGQSSASAGRSFYTRESYYTRQMEDGYIESRRETMPPPRVMTRGEYYQKSIEDTRTLLGRENE